MKTGKGRPSAFVGRGAELARLRTLLARCAAQSSSAGAGGAQGQVVLVSAAAGMGRTRLVEEALTAVTGLVTVHCGAAVEHADRPFGPLVEALGLAPTATPPPTPTPTDPDPDPERARLARLADTVPADHTGGAARGVDGARQAVVDSVVALLRRGAVATERPTVIVLEDLQWADPATLAAIPELARRLADVPVLLVGTLCPVPQVRSLDRLVDRLVVGGATLLRLRPLDPADVVDLAATVLAGQPGPRLREQLADCGGSPALLVDLLTTLDRAGGLVAAGGVVELGQQTPAPVLRDAVRAQVAHLSDATAEMVYLAAVLGESFPLGELAVVAARSVSDLLPQLDEAIRAGILAQADDRLGFQPGLARTALYSGLPAARRARLHLRAGRALAAAGAPARRVAGHFAVAAEPGDAQAARWLHVAGTEVARESLPRGIDLLRRALTVAGPDLPARPAIAADLAALLVLGGRFDDADRVATEALSSDPDGAAAARLRATRADAAILTGRLRAALDHLGGAPDGRAALALLGRGDLDGARHRADRAAAAAKAVGDEPASAASAVLPGSVSAAVSPSRSPSRSPSGSVAVLATASAWVALAEGEYRAAADAATGAVALTEPARLAAELAGATPQLALAAALAELDRFDEATLLVQESHRRARRVGADALLGGLLASLAALRLHRGDWDGAVSDADAALRAARRVGAHPGFIPAAVLARIAVARGDLLDARRVTAAADAEPTDLVVGRDWLRWVHALASEAEGRVDEAATTMRAGWEEAASVRHLLTPRLLHRDAVRLALAAGERTHAATVVDQLEARAGRGEGSLTGAALWCRGLLEGDPELLTRAVHAYCGGPRLVEIAALSEDTGVAFGRIGERRESARFLAVAEKGYTRFGASADLARVRAALRAVGVRPNRPHGTGRTGAVTRAGGSGRRGRPTFGWDALTDTEGVVAGLVAEGLSNPKIAERLHISRYTVETHLKRVFVKLDLSSRAALAAEVIRRQTPTP